MASKKTTLCFSFAIITTAVIVSATAADNFCSTADDKPLCTRLIGGGKTREEAMTNAINAVLVKAAAGKSITDVIASKLPRKLKPVTKESITETCHEAYDNLIDNLKECIGFVKSDPYASLSIRLSSISYSDCVQGLSEFGLSVPEATQFSDEILKLRSTLLAVAEENFCSTADDKTLCTQLIGGGKTREEAMTNAINTVLVKAATGKSIANVVASKLPRKLKPVTKESITETCHEAYDNLIDNLKECIGFVKSDPYASLSIHLSSVSYSDCVQGLSEFGLSVPEATQFSDEILKLRSTLLAVAEEKQ